MLYRTRVELYPSVGACSVNDFETGAIFLKFGAHIYFFALLLLVGLLPFRGTLAAGNGACDAGDGHEAQLRQDMADAVGRMFARSGAFNGLNHACYGAGSVADGWIDAKGDLAYWDRYLDREQLEDVRAAYLESFERYKDVPCIGNWQRTFVGQLVFTRKVYLSQQEIALSRARQLGACAEN